MPQRLAALFGVLFLAASAFGQPGRTASRPLFTFETPNELSRLSKTAENVTLTLVQDGGVTEGELAARLVMPRRAEYSVLRFDAIAMQDWRDFDYLAIDVTTEDEAAYPLVLELWDAASKNYATRCTFEGITTRAGKQTLLYPINRARRNGKEGRAWEELEPQDKIDLGRLTQVKLFTTPRKDRDLVLTIDHIRLLQEDAAKPKLRLPLPDGAIAFNFGSPGSTAPGFRTISATDPGFSDAKELMHAGDGWPDLLSGTFIMGGDGQRISFQTKVPNGEYHYWLIAGPIYRQEQVDLRYTLQIGQQSLVDDHPTRAAYLGEKYLYRFMQTPYSEQPHALWRNYIERMYPTHTGDITITDGMLTLTARNHFVSALVLLPKTVDAASFAEQAQMIRREAFEKTIRPFKQVKPQPSGAYAAFTPDPFAEIKPWTKAGPGSDRALAGAPGQGIVTRLAIVPFGDFGECRITVSELKGPGIIPATACRTYWQEYRSDGEQISEMALLPTMTRRIEKGITQCAWFWWQLPSDAKPGKYTGTITATFTAGEPMSVPLTVEVYPFRLIDDLPLSLGMYYSPRQAQGLPAERHRELLKQQLQFMREIGFTATTFGQPTITGIRGKRVQLTFDPTMADLAKEVGMGQHPLQYQMGGTLGIGRAIGRRLPGSEGPLVDRNPGIELRQPGFPALFVDAAKQYADIIREKGLPVAVEIADEPREVPNPWNRNLADTNRYGDLVKQAGLIGFVTPMADANGGRDYTTLVDHTDIISVHAWKASERLIARTRARKKTLWLYNTGMDRLSWGFYNWAVGSAGRWEWHFGWVEDGAKGGYPGREWFNPFTAMHGFTSYAPLAYPGGMLFTSRFFDVMEGINDSKYIFTIERMIEQRAKEGTHGMVIAEAKELLMSIRQTIPAFPDAKGLGDDQSGALVGQGFDSPVRLNCPKWRQQLANLLIRLDAPERR